MTDVKVAKYEVLSCEFIGGRLRRRAHDTLRPQPLPTVYGVGVLCLKGLGTTVLIGLELGMASLTSDPTAFSIRGKYRSISLVHDGNFLVRSQRVLEILSIVKVRSGEVELAARIAAMKNQHIRYLLDIVVATRAIGPIIVWLAVHNRHGWSVVDLLCHSAWLDVFWCDR